MKLREINLHNDWQPLYSALVTRILKSPYEERQHEEILNTFLSHYFPRSRPKTYAYQYCTRCGTRNIASLLFVSSSTYICGSCIEDREVKKPTQLFQTSLFVYRKGGDKLLNIDH